MSDKSPEGTKLSISLVPCWEIYRVWNKVKPHLERATKISEGRYDIEDLHLKLEDGEFSLWIVFDDEMNIIAAITTTFTQYPQGLMCAGQFLGGDRLEDWQDNFCALLESWAKDHGCKAIEFAGRPGWARVLGRNGYREVFRTFQRDLT